MTIEYRDGQFSIRPPTKQPIPAISEWVGWRRWPDGHYTARAYPSSCLSVGSSPGLQVTWSLEAGQKRDELLRGLQCGKDCLSKPPSPAVRAAYRWPTEREPRDYQLQAIAAAKWLVDSALICDDMGLGKTSTSLWCLHQTGATRALVICPVSVKFNWQSEFALTLGERWQVSVIDGTSKQRAQQLVDLMRPVLEMRYVLHEARVEMPRAAIINYDLLRHLTPEQLAMLKQLVAGQALICDESHYLKSRDAERTKLVRELAKGAAFRFLLTGTPVRNLVDDLFSQVSLVRPEIWSSYRDFARRYLVERPVTFGKKTVTKVVGSRNTEELNAVLNTVMIRRKKEEIGGLPPKIFTYPEITLDRDTRAIYDAMRKFARFELGKLMQVSMDQPDQEVMRAGKMTVFDPRARSAVEAAMRCEQIAQGFVGGIPDPVMQRLDPKVLRAAEKITGRPNELIFPRSPKIIWLMEAIDSVLKQGGAPLVFTRFNAPAFWLCERLQSQNVNAAFMHGGLSAVEKHELATGFQERRFDVLIAQVKISEGWNAYRSQDVLFLGRDWSHAINDQATSRAHREGQKGTVNVQIPVVRDTIEVLHHRRLLAKQADADKALRELTVAQLMEAL